MEIHQKCCLFSELAAVIRINGTVRMKIGSEANIRIVTENAAFARRLFSSVKKLFNLYPEVIIRKSKKLKKHTSYILVLTSPMLVKSLTQMTGVSLSEEYTRGFPVMTSSGPVITGNSCCRKAYMRGAFLAGGSVSDPEKTYHLEITTHSLNSANELCAIINKYNLNSKVIKRKGSYIAYLKEGENIVDFLNIIGAHAALMELENVRILKEMRNNVNRVVNCETANLEKTVNASIRQVENIRLIRDALGFEKLPENLQEIAQLRLDYSEANLKELGEMLHPCLGKSGVNHRLRKLDEIADDLRRHAGREEKHSQNEKI